MKLRIVQYCLLMAVLLCSCAKEEEIHKTSLLLKTGVIYTPNNSSVKLGGTIRIGVLASGDGVPLTYIRIERITNHDTIVQLDRGIFSESEGFDEDFTFSKDTAQKEQWRITVMNADRDTAVKTLNIYRASGSDWKPVKYFNNIELCLQDNSTGNYFLDIDNGLVYNTESVKSHESEVDILGYFYFTSGVPSPSLTCPGYTSAIGYYPEIVSWPVKNSTSFDYYSSDNNLISAEAFESATNDSLLVTSYKADKVSGNCKFCYTGKVIPFKTSNGKYGLIKIEHADQTTDGMIKMSVKIQE